jgi:hypothetical protein
MGSLLGGFPMYGPISSGPFHVSLSMPGPISDISKSIGITSSTSILLPNIDYLVKFTNGDIGIADTLKKNMILKQINKCQNEDTFKHFANLVKLDIQDPSKYKTKNGYSIPKNLITLDTSQDLMGIKAMEKTILKSIFETQKPFIEISKLVVENLAKIEDVIARFMPILATTDVAGKLSIQSEKPKTNAGNGSRPKALGYQSGSDIKPSLGKMQSISNKGKKIKTDRFGNITTIPERINPSKKDVDHPELGSTDIIDSNFKIVSTVYSTGTFDPKIDYTYIYKDIVDDSFGNDDLSDLSDLSLEDDDPFQKFKPKIAIFGIFNSKGDPINPFTKIKALDGTIDPITQNPTEVDTDFYVADWITKSPKWVMPNNINNQSAQYTWSRFGTPFYFWERGGDVKRSKTAPDPGENNSAYEKKKYEEGDRKGQFIVDFNGTDERKEFVDYFTTLVSKKINASNDLSPDEKSEAINSIISKLYEKDENGSIQVGPYTLNKTQIDNHLDNAFKYGILNSSKFINPNNGQEIAIPSGIKYPLKPSKINVGGNEIFIDPEADYDLKVIKVDSVLDIRYEDSQGQPEISTQILNFIKNSISISIDKNGTKLPFNISIAKNQGIPNIQNNITEYQLDNWNYDDIDGILGKQIPQINNANSYSIEIWRSDENPYFIGKSNVIFPLQNNIFIEMIKIENIQSSIEWSYKEYKLTSTTKTISPSIGSLLEFDLTGAPNINGENVTKIKIQNITSLTISTSNGNIIVPAYSKIIKWYYVKSNTTIPNWYTNPPSSWSTPKKISIEWTMIGESTYIPNGNLPPTRKVKTSKYKIDNKSIQQTSETYSQIWILNDIIVTEEIRTYITVENGEKTLGEGSVIEVENYKVKKWIIWKETITSITTINSKIILPDYLKNNEISLLYETFGNNEKFRININSIQLPPFQIRVKDSTKYGKMIDPSKISNSQFSTSDLYSQTKYGGSPQEVGLYKRYMKTELDTETYYIIEGILVDNNTQNNIGGNNSSQIENIEWYKMPSAIGATKVFLSILSDIFSKLIPAIKKLLALFKNPSKFITDIISEKLGESFLLFSPEAMDIMKKLQNLPPNERSKFVKSSILNNYISVNSDGSYKFLLDGSGLTNLSILGVNITFGMQLSMLTPLIKLISSIDFNNLPTKNLNDFLNNRDSNVSPFDDLGNIDLRADQNSTKNQIVTESNGKKNTENVSIQYSTGKFIEGINYQYIYLTEYVANLIKEADMLEETNDPDNLNEAQAKIELALKSDPNNPLLKSKFDDLFKKTNSYIQPILKFLIEIVSLPIKIISGIIKWIMDFFQSLSSLPSLPNKMKEFLTFNWILDFFSPAGLLSLAGIKFDIPKLLGWVSNLNSFPDDYEFDLSEVIDIALLMKQPTVKKAQFIDMLKKPFRILYSILCLLESLINGIIDFIWSLMGIEAIIPAPHIKICKQLNDDLSPEDIMDLLNGLIKDKGSESNTSPSTSNTYNFIYDINLSDGRSLRELNSEELKNFIEDNKDISFDFLFD